MGPRRGIQALCALRRPALAALVQRAQRGRRADWIGIARWGGFGILIQFAIRARSRTTRRNWVQPEPFMFRKSAAVLKNNLREFKEFALKGNLIQLAIAVVLGGAFGGLIKSFVDNIFLPLLSVFGAK